MIKNASGLQLNSNSQARYVGLDYFRVLCTLFVIYIHVYGVLHGAIVSQGSSSYSSMILDYLKQLSRISVPGFVLLSGAFVLGRTSQPQVFSFYRHVFFKTVMPFLLVAGYHLLNAGLTHHEQGMSLDVNIYTLSARFIFGYSSYHLWYMNLFIELMLLTPILWWVKKRIPQQLFSAIGWAWLIIAIFAYEQFHPSHHIGESAFYMGYYILGDTLRHTLKLHKHWLALLMCALLVIVLTKTYATSETIEYLHPAVAITSLLIYTSAWGWKLPKLTIISNLAANSLIIYLVHVAFFHELILYNITHLQPFAANCACTFILSVCIITLCFSWGTAEIWRRANLLFHRYLTSHA